MYLFLKVETRMQSYLLSSERSHGMFSENLVFLSLIDEILASLLILTAASGVCPFVLKALIL